MNNGTSNTIRATACLHLMSGNSIFSHIFGFQLFDRHRGRTLVSLSWVVLEDVEMLRPYSATSLVYFAPGLYSSTSNDSEKLYWPPHGWLVYCLRPWTRNFSRIQRSTVGSYQEIKRIPVQQFMFLIDRLERSWVCSLQAYRGVKHSVEE